MAELDATALVGLLADPHRRRVIAAIDHGFLDRADGQYWRTGGTVEP